MNPMKTKLSPLVASLLLAGLLGSANALANEDMHHDMDAMAGMMHQETSSYPLHGKVVKIENGRVVLDHQAVAALKWPAMVMPFQVADAKLLEGLAPGQEIQATFEVVPNASPRILTLEPAR